MLLYVLELRKKLCYGFSEISNLELDITILDEFEEKEFSFINRVNAEILNI
jgi:hypothetical protein